MKTKEIGMFFVLGVFVGNSIARADLTQVAHVGSHDSKPPGTLFDVMKSVLREVDFDVNSADNRTDDSLDRTWKFTSGSAVFEVLFTMANDDNSFCVYDVSDPSHRLELFAGHAQGPTDARVSYAEGTVTFRGKSLYVGETFGLYFQTSRAPGGVPWYSDEHLNDKGFDHMVTLTTDRRRDLDLGAPGLGDWAVHGLPLIAWNPDSYILGWEDEGPDGDLDFQDLVIKTRGLVPSSR